MTAERRLRITAVVAPALVATTYALLVFGSTVRIHDAGLACPDWPMCFGQVVPVVDFQVGLEFGHRVLAGIISLGFVALAGLALSVRAARVATWPWFVVAAVVLATQIVLGGLALLELLAEWTVTSHLVAGNTFCALLLVIALRLRDVRVAPVRAPLAAGARVAPFVLLAAVAVQVALGGFVASSHAGLACGPAWPTCGGSAWFPTFAGAVGLQVLHRIGAYAVLGIAGAVAALVWRQGRVGSAARVVVGVVIAQAALGIINVWWAMPAEITALHSAGAALVVLTTTWMCYEAALAAALAAGRAPRSVALEAR